MLETQIRKPKKLDIGDTIALAAMTRPSDKVILDQSSQFLEKQGFKVVLPKNLNQQYGYLAGKDLIRVSALMDLILDPSINAIWALGGGYGCARLLPLLDFKKIRHQPKIFIGYSDISALHASLNSISNVTSILGPTLADIFGARQRKTATSIMNHCLERLLSKEKLQIDLKLCPKLNVLNHGKACARLVGGNLAVITSLLGTPYALDVKSKILLIEDVNEPPYKVDRMLNQLKLSGALSSLKGVILGDFHNCDAKAEKSFSLEQVFLDYFKKAPYPVISGFPSGHMENMQTFPLNCLVKLDTVSNRLNYLESYFSN